VNPCFAAVVLAGGFSSRMQQLKPILPLGEETITDHIITTFTVTGVDVFLVTGYRREDVEAGIRRRDITVVYNPDYEQGMLSSIRAGLRQLPATYQSFFILPVDIPLVRPPTILRLIDAMLTDADKIIYPVFRRKRGHPPLIPAGLIPDILEWEGNGGLQAILSSREELAREIPVADSFILGDIDTQEDYTVLLERYRRYDIPTDEECRAILEDICHVDTDRIKHNSKVAEAAVIIGRALNDAGYKVDVEAVRAAAVLHDIAKGQRKHDIVGGNMLREMGFGRVADIVGVHSDLAGGNTQLPLEEKIVYLADKLVDGERLVSLEERYSSANRRFGVTPEIETAIMARLKVAQGVKKEMENLLGSPLEKLISG
jgi:molybdenum cofactor cytidylyltransferase